MLLAKWTSSCLPCTSQVPAKVNAISIDSCSKTGVIFGDLISSCEAINCSRLQLQCTGSVPTLAIEKTDGVQLYLPETVGRLVCDYFTFTNGN